MMRTYRKYYFLVIFFLFSSPLLQAQVAESVEVVTVRPGVTQSYVMLTPEKPVATVILFAGYGGYLNITQAGIQQPSNNFLVRTRKQFAEKGFVTVVVDTPSDFAGVDGILGWRATQTHASDLQKIITRLRQHADVPIWLVGTSRGTISAANAAARLNTNGADGLVLTATVVDSGGRNPGYIEDVDLEDIRMPTLIVHHENDDCIVCDFYAAKRLPGKIKNAPRIKFIQVTGGKDPESGSCGPLSEHGFYGIEEKVINAIAAFINN